MPYIKKPAPDKLTTLLRGHCSIADVARALDVTWLTASKKVKDPNRFTLWELRQISRNLHIPKDEIMGAIKW